MSKSALDGSRWNGFRLNPFDIIMVGGDGPNDVPDSPELHHLFDRRVFLPLQDGLVDSILDIGMEQPITVVKYGGEPHLVVGRQRLKAAREIKAKHNTEYEVPVIVTSGTPDKLFAMIVAENNVRYAENPIELLEKIEFYMTTWQKSEKDAARLVGMSLNNVRRIRQINGLAPSILKQVQSGTVGVDTVLPLVDLKPEEQVAKFEELKAKGIKPTNRHVREATGGIVVPSKRTVVKMLKIEQDKRPAIKPEYDSFWGALQFMSGQVSAQDVGLSEFVAEMSKSPPKPAKDPNAPKKSRGRPKKTIAENTAALVEALGSVSPETPETCLTTDETPETPETPSETPETSEAPTEFKPAKRRSTQATA